jgi:hypothetical protein
MGGACRTGIGMDDIDGCAAFDAEWIELPGTLVGAVAAAGVQLPSTSLLAGVSPYSTGEEFAQAFLSGLNADVYSKATALFVHEVHQCPSIDLAVDSDIAVMIVGVCGHKPKPTPTKPFQPLTGSKLFPKNGPVTSTNSFTKDGSTFGSLINDSAQSLVSDGDSSSDGGSSSVGTDTFPAFHPGHRRLLGWRSRLSRPSRTFQVPAPTLANGSSTSGPISVGGPPTTTQYENGGTVVNITYATD